jgi:hypothetical protein
VVWASVALVLPQEAKASPAGHDAQHLRSLHEKVLQAHRQGDVELLLEDEAEDYVVANRGEVTRPGLEERRERLGKYLRRTAFREYRDAEDPVVQVSSDGTLGWVIAKVQARGTQKNPDGRSEPIEFASAWVELYQKRGGRWYRVGNVSNFKP